MVIYVLTDLEGVGGVEHWDPHVYRTPEELAWKEGCVQLLVGEVNAAVRGALAAGASEVRVYDGHGGGNNFSRWRLHRGASLVNDEGGSGWLPQLDDVVDALVIIGQHAMEGAVSAVLPHSWSRSRPRRCHLNDSEVGEAGAAIALAAYHGVRTVFLSGDEAATDEARRRSPEMEVVSVKSVVPEGVIDHMAPQQACEEIEAGVRRALHRRNEISALELRAPFRFRVSFLRAPGMGLPLALARVAGSTPRRIVLERAGFQMREWGVEATVLDARTIEFSGEALPDVLSCALRRPAPASRAASGASP